MLALSTSWQSGESITAEGMLAALKNLEINGIELSYHISEDLYHEIKNPLKRSDLKVVSIHNYFPIPPVKSVKRIQRAVAICFCFQARMMKNASMQ